MLPSCFSVFTQNLRSNLIQFIYSLTTQNITLAHVSKQNENQKCVLIKTIGVSKQIAGKDKYTPIFKI